MRQILKGWAHALVSLIERAQDFSLHEELPLRTKLAFLMGVYEPETSRYIRSLRGRIAVDVGAHVGYYSRMLARNFDTVYAFEADPYNFSFLKRNVRRYRNIIPVNMAVSDSIGEKDFFRVKHSTFRHSLRDEGKNTERITIGATTLDHFLESAQGIDLVKIDVEGAEEQVLQGMKQIRLTYAPRIIVERPIGSTGMPISPPIGSRGAVQNFVLDAP